MDVTFVNAAFAAVAFAMTFGVVRAVKYVRGKRRMKLIRQAHTQRPVAAPGETRNKNKRRRLEQMAEKEARATQRDPRKG